MASFSWWSISSLSSFDCFNSFVKVSSLKTKTTYGLFSGNNILFVKKVKSGLKLLQGRCLVNKRFYLFQATKAYKLHWKSHLYTVILLQALYRHYVFVRVFVVCKPTALFSCCSLFLFSLSVSIRPTSAVFARFSPATRFRFEFWLVHAVVYTCCDWSDAFTLLLASRRQKTTLTHISSPLPFKSVFPFLHSFVVNNIVRQLWFALSLR